MNNVDKEIVARMKDLFEAERNKDNQAYFYIKFLYKLFVPDHKDLKYAADQLGFWYEEQPHGKLPILSWGMPMEKAKAYFDKSKVIEYDLNICQRQINKK